MAGRTIFHKYSDIAASRILNISVVSAYDDSLRLPNVSSSAQTTLFKFLKNAGPSAYLLLNDDNVTEAMKLFEIVSPFMPKFNPDTILTVYLQRTGFEGDRGEFLG